jgi:hypothetical protein
MATRLNPLATGAEMSDEPGDGEWGDLGDEIQDRIDDAIEVEMEKRTAMTDHATRAREIAERLANWVVTKRPVYFECETVFKKELAAALDQAAQEAVKAYQKAIDGPTDSHVCHACDGKGWTE